MKKILRSALCIVMVLSMLLLAACGSQNDTNDTTDKKYVIGISQYVTHDALDAATQGFKDAVIELFGEGNVEFSEHNAANDPANCTTIANQLISSEVDLIFANATPSLSAAASATNTIPILGTSVTDYGTALNITDWTGVTGKNVSGTSDLAPLADQADMLNQLCPVEEYPTVGILYCSGEANSLYQVNVIQPILESFGYTVNRYAFSDTNDVSAVATTACSEADVLYIPTDNTAASCTSAIDNVASPKNIPIICGEEGICKGCGVATLTISYYDIGYKTGEMAYDVLVNGADIASMEIEFAPETVKKFRADKAETLGITIPEDYVAIEE